MDGRRRWVVGSALVLSGCAPTVNATSTGDGETTAANASSSSSTTASGIVSAFLPGANTPILATPDQLIRVGLQ